MLDMAERSPLKREDVDSNSTRSPKNIMSELSDKLDKLFANLRCIRSGKHNASLIYHNGSFDHWWIDERPCSLCQTEEYEKYIEEQKHMRG